MEGKINRLEEENGRVRENNRLLYAKQRKNLQLKADKEKELETTIMKIQALEEQLAKYKCCVCLDFYHAGDVGSLTCGHVGHKECLSAAVTISKKCPKCRKPHPTVVVLDEGEKMEVETSNIFSRL